MSIEYNFAASQVQGQRDYQEDSYQILKEVILPDQQEGILLILCDGMGGHAGGEVASGLVCDSFREAFDRSSLAVSERFNDALETAHHTLIEYTKNHSEHQGMGTTLIAACITGKQLYWISVGDSPLWLLRQGELKRLNADHSMAPIFAKMVEMGELTVEEASNDPKRHALRSVMSSGKIKEIDVSDKAFDLLAGDQIILASDGVETLSDEKLVQIFLSDNQLSCEQTLCQLLVAVEAEEKAEQDNASVILYRVEEESVATAHGTAELLHSGKSTKENSEAVVIQSAKGILLASLAIFTIFGGMKFYDSWIIASKPPNPLEPIFWFEKEAPFRWLGDDFGRSMAFILSDFSAIPELSCQPVYIDDISESKIILSEIKALMNQQLNIKEGVEETVSATELNADLEKKADSTVLDRKHELIHSIAPISNAVIDKNSAARNPQQ